MRVGLVGRLLDARTSAPRMNISAAEGIAERESMTMSKNHEATSLASGERRTTNHEP